jgi:hypothetical protein
MIVKRCKPELPLDQVVEAHRAQTLPLFGHPGLTVRDEANVMTAFAFRDAGLEDFVSASAAGSVSRLSNAEMEQLLVATSARLAHWLAVREHYLGEDPAAYRQLVTMAKMISTDEWEREALTAELRSAPQCRACYALINEAWHYCPACGRALRH